MTDEGRKLDRDFHDRGAARYDREVTSVFRPYHRLALHPWVESLPGHCRAGRALDLGTGTGLVALRLARACREVVGLDHSSAMLDLARRAASSQGLTNLTFLAGDCHSLPFPDGAFEVVTIQGLLHHHGSVDWRLALSEAVRVLAPGGLLYVSEPCTESGGMARLLARLIGFGIRLYPWLRHPLRKVALRRLSKSAPGPPAAPQTPAVVEAPLPARLISDELRRLGLTFRARFLTDVPRVSSLSKRSADFFIRLASFAAGPRHGDIVFIYAAKPQAG